MAVRQMGHHDQRSDIPYAEDCAEDTLSAWNKLRDWNMLEMFFLGN